MRLHETPSCFIEFVMPHTANQEQEHSAPRWFLRGMAGVVSIPAFILLSAYVGFAGLAREAGISASEAAFMTGFMWALPNQVVLVGAMSGGVSMLTAAIAVSLSGVRLMPMIVAWVPNVRGPRTPLWKLLLLSHFVAVTSWVVSMMRLPHLPTTARVPYFFGFAVTLATAVVTVTAVAHSAIGALPLMIAGALAFLTPVYFLISIFQTASVWSDRAAMIFGLALGPVFFLLAPGLDLLWTGVVGGTAAYLGGRWRRRA